ncbi:hypothetical protein BASA81_007316 [Batrachochytrium salamandrivorans]|nr:hypothetical protein BASA81_007316 [Batrachochytrium salamandrivorans]
MDSPPTPPPPSTQVICIGPFCIPIGDGVLPFLAALVAAVRDRIYNFFFSRPVDHQKKTDAVIGGGPDLVHLASDSEFASLLQTKQKLILDFTASWCGPCQTIKPVFAKLSEENTGVCFVTIDVDQFEDLAERFGVKAMPTFVGVERGGKEVGRVLGAQEGELRSLVGRI